MAAPNLMRLGLNRKKPKGRVSGAKPDINVVPMADIMLVLLIIFMITTPFLVDPIAINPARAKSAQVQPEVDAEDATTVTIQRDRTLYVNNVVVTDEDLFDRLSDRVALAPEKPLFIRSDVAAPYGRVVEVVNRARDLGVERIGLIVEREREGGL